MNDIEFKEYLRKERLSYGISQVGSPICPALQDSTSMNLKQANPMPVTV